MPRYRYVGDDERVLMGLAHGVNAELHRAGEDGETIDFTALDGSTVVAQPSDEVTTTAPYPNALLVNVDTDQPDLFPIGEQGPELVSDPDGVVVHTAERTAEAAAAGDLPSLTRPRKPRTLKPPATPADQSTTDPRGEEQPS